MLSAPAQMGLQRLGNAQCRAHSFLIPGTQIIVFIGGQTDLVKDKLSDNSGVTFYEWSFSNSGISRGASELVLATKPKGKLAKQMES